MTALRLLVAALTAAVGMAAVPAQAQSDTTPPQLVSLSVTPNQVDVSSGAQSVTVSAVITDDISGVCADGDSSCTHATSSVASPSGQQRVLLGYFTLVSGDSYTAEAMFPQFAEEGIWKDWSIQLTDRAGNLVVLGEFDLLSQGINAAVGVGSLEESYARSVSLRVRRTRASGRVSAPLESTCFWFVPVTLQRRTASGWRQVGTMLSSYQGGFSFHIRREGKYRAIATSFGIGTPNLTTCTQASQTARS